MPLDPAIVGAGLEELHALRNRVRRTWLRHESLRVVTGCNRALLREARVTVARRQTACEIAALLRSPHCGVLRQTEIRLHFYETGRAAADNRSRDKSYSNTNRGSAARRHFHSGGIKVIQD